MRVQIINWFPKFESKYGNVGSISVMDLIWCFPAEAFGGCMVHQVDCMRNAITPELGRCPIEINYKLAFALYVLYLTFSLVLLLVVGLGSSLGYAVSPAYRGPFPLSFFRGIVAGNKAGDSDGTDKILQRIRSIAFRFAKVNKSEATFSTREELGTCKAPDGNGVIGKERISEHAFTETAGSEHREPAKMVTARGCSGLRLNSINKLGGIFQGAVHHIQGNTAEAAAPICEFGWAPVTVTTSPPDVVVAP